MANLISLEDRTITVAHMGSLLAGHTKGQAGSSRDLPKDFLRLRLSRLSASQRFRVAEAWDQSRSGELTDSGDVGFWGRVVLVQPFRSGGYFTEVKRGVCNSGFL